MLFPLLPVADKLMTGSFSKYRSIPVENLAKAMAAFSGQQGSGTRVLYWQDMVGA
jgi:hypothetical protein